MAKQECVGSLAPYVLPFPPKFGKSSHVSIISLSKDQAWLHVLKTHDLMKL